ncbi:hypothetical protein HAX54_047170 [Datura stramonium]|uniref:Uncharacterized protein n=1 Tax=Datura stramonium TaxID=4076 RepID=A0ABS8SS13_DATST|nr:hypothetical protein [Datura stramonium]
MALAASVEEDSIWPLWPLYNGTQYGPRDLNITAITNHHRYAFDSITGTHTGESAKLYICELYKRNTEKRALDGKSKGCKNEVNDLSELPKKTYIVPPCFDPMEDDPLHRQDEVEVMQDMTRQSETGSLVRDRNMCPLRVHSWEDIEEAKLDHMWGAVTEVLKYVSSGIEKSDWEWLEKSTRNEIKRSKLILPHRTGSKPIREIIYELGGKHGNPPDMATIFFETRKKEKKILEPETYENMYVENRELQKVEPSLSNIEVVKRCFRPQCKSHVVGFGGGITSKELKGGSSAKVALLEEPNASRKERVALLDELNVSRKENESMKIRMDNIEKKCELLFQKRCLDDIHHLIVK